MKNFIKTFAAGLLSTLTHFLAIFCGVLTVFCWMSINDCTSPWGAIAVFFCALILTMLEFLLLHSLGQVATGKITMVDWLRDELR